MWRVSVRPSVRPYVRTYVRPRVIFNDFHDFCDFQGFSEIRGPDSKSLFRGLPEVKIQ